MALEDLPYIDEHSIEVAAQPDAVFEAVIATFARFLSGRLGPVLSRLWGCQPPKAFEVIEQQRPTLLIMAGKHRFSRYGIVFRIAPTATGSTLSAESRAEFPGLAGGVYRAAVIGTRGHVVATRGLLRTIAGAARR